MEREPSPEQPEERKPLRYTDGEETYNFKPDRTVIMTFRKDSYMNCIIQLTSEMEVKNVVFGNEWLIGFMLGTETDKAGNSMREYFGWQPRQVTADEVPEWIAEGWYEMQLEDLEHPERLIEGE